MHPQSGDDDLRREVRVLFVSEGNVCRSVIAEAVFRGLLEQEGLADAISCESKVRVVYPQRWCTLNGVVPSRWCTLMQGGIANA